MIRSTFLGFETAKRALSASQAGLDTVGHNISNVNTAGYTRQRIDQVSVGMGGMSLKYQVFGANNTGLGVNVNGISQIRDTYLDNRYRTEASSYGEFSVKQDGLTDINNIFDEMMTDGLHYKFGQLINDLTSLMETADSEELATVLRSRAKELTDMLNTSAKQLEEARTQTTSDLTITVEQQVNSILERISTLNGLIKEDNLYGNPSNELNDERNLLIDQLSEYMDIRVVRTPVKVSGDVTLEQLSIELKDSGSPPLKLVDSTSFNKLGITADETTGNVRVALLDGVSGNEITDLTSKLYKGAIKGYIDVLNGKGPNAAGVGESTFRGIPYYQKSLDEFAQMLAEVFNRVNNVTEDESLLSDGSISATTDKNLFVPNLLTVLDTAANPKPDWMDTIVAGSLQFSEKQYSIDFVNDSPSAGQITATINGKTYIGEYTGPNSKIDFYEYNEVDDGAGGTVLELAGNRAFTVLTTDAAPSTTTSPVKIDATINAKNITISSSWLDDPLYITTSKEKPVTNAQPVLKLIGSSNPSWIDKISSGNESIKISDGHYVVNYDSTSPATISVKIGGVTYSAEYKKNSELQLIGGTPPVVGLTIVTNSRTPTSVDSANTMNIANSTGAKSDNLSKFLTEIKSSNNYPNSGFSGGFREFLVAYLGDMAGDKGTNTSYLAASTTVITSYSDRRDAVSAVSIDEEGINMMTYQNYYNAAARYLTTLDEALDKIINGMGTVGR